MTGRVPATPGTALARLQAAVELTASAGAVPDARIAIRHGDVVAILDALDLLDDAARHAAMRLHGRGDVDASTVVAVLAELGARPEAGEPPPLRRWPTNDAERAAMIAAAPRPAAAARAVGRYATPAAPVVVAFSTRSEGLVLRWYAAVEDYARHRPLVMAHRHRATSLSDACDEATFLAALLVVDELAVAYRGFVVDDDAVAAVAAGATHRPDPTNLPTLRPVQEQT